MAIYHRALMHTALPNWVSPFKLLAAGEPVEGCVPISALARLRDSLHSPGGEAEISLEFIYDGRRGAQVKVKARAELRLTCQRCLQAVIWPVNSESRLKLVADESEGERGEEFLVVEDQGISPTSIAEDELILALPLVARHADVQNCMPDNPVAPEQDEPHNRPFDVLRQLKS